jgi:hypothetical protein
MNLDSFKALVDAVPQAQGSSQPAEHPEALLAEIRACFTTRESDQARSDVRNIINDLGLRHICDEVPCEPYVSVASGLQQALRERGNSISPSSDWQRAVELGTRYASQCSSGLPHDQSWIANVKVSTLSAAIDGLRAKGYQIDLPMTGGVDVPTATTAKLAADIASLSASLGQALACSAANGIATTYNSALGRYDLGRPGATVQLAAKPELPLAYLYQLGLRYFNAAPSANNPAAALSKLSELVSHATALLDLTSTIYDTIFARARDIVGILQKSAVYDSVFLVTQASPAHAREYLSWMLANHELANLKDKAGRTTHQIKRLAEMLLSESEKTHPRDFIIIDPINVAAELGIADAMFVTNMLADVFVHPKGANQKLTFPPKDTDVDAAFRPLLLAFGKIWMQPGPIGARAVVNAALDWCKKAWPTKGFDDEALGPLFELFVRAKLKAKGVSVHHGHYSVGQSVGECDAVVETQKTLIFIELKTKMLTRAARSGDDITALFDLAQALVRPQAQAMERHAVLRENGSFTLTDDASSHQLHFDKREMLKVSVTRGDLGSLHDRAFLQQFLRFGCLATFQAIDATQQSKLAELHTQFSKLKSAADRAQEPYLSAQFPFERSWSLSVYHLLMLLERTTDSESFSRELQRTRRLLTPRKDFYAEYAYALELEKHLPPTSNITS